MRNPQTSSGHPPPTRTQGFTLIELLIVIAIIGILAAVLIPALLGAQKRSYDAGAMSCAKSLESVQGLSQIDRNSYSVIGTGAGKISSSTDGVNSACKAADLFVVDRSDATTLTSTYTFDLWDRRGKQVFTVTPTSVRANVSGATAFSDTGAGGSNLP